MDGNLTIQPAAVALPGAAKGKAVSAADDWFDQEVLPIEAILMQYLERNWRNPNDVPDLRQDVYVRVYQAALKQIPENAKHFVLATARNLLIDKSKHERIVSIETAADLDEFGVAADVPGPDQIALARDELRHLQLLRESQSPSSVELARIFPQGIGLAHLYWRLRGLFQRHVA